MSDHIPYGPEWEAEMMKWSKAALIGLLQKACLKKQARKPSGKARTPLRLHSSRKPVLAHLLLDPENHPRATLICDLKTAQEIEKALNEG
jgi:hypothetical protein